MQSTTNRETEINKKATNFNKRSESWMQLSMLEPLTMNKTTLLQNGFQVALSILCMCNRNAQSGGSVLKWFWLVAGFCLFIYQGERFWIICQISTTTAFRCTGNRFLLKAKELAILERKPQIKVLLTEVKGAS